MAKLRIDGIIWSGMARDIQNQLDRLNGEDLIVEIASPGGFVYPGLRIFNILKNYKGNVTTHLMGLAASMASYIALAGDKITAESNTVYMIHNVSTWEDGDYNLFRKTADVLEGLTNLLAKTYAERTGKDLAEIRALMDAESYFFGDEAQKAGFVDEIIETGKKKEKGSAVAEARLEIENCFSEMKQKGSDDIEKIAACLDSSDIKLNGAKNKSSVILTDEKTNNKTEDKTMTLEELKKDHPDLVAQIEKAARDAGIAQERDRVNAHLTLASSSGDLLFAVDCIEKGKSTTEENVIAHYMAAGMKNNALENHAADGEETADLETDGDVDEDKLAADLLDKVMANSKVKEGAAIAMDTPEA